jgi:biopolymer transport protein ExbD
MPVDDGELERGATQQVSRQAEESRAIVAVEPDVSDDALVRVLRRIRHAGVANVSLLMPQPR